MFSRLFLPLMLIFSTTGQAHNDGSEQGYACRNYPQETIRMRETDRGYGGCGGGQHRRGEGFRGPRMGGRRDWGRHSRWDIPVQEARRLNPIEVSPQSLERGETLFRDNCTRCHGAYGFGDGLQAKDLRVLPPPLRHATRHYNDGELFYIIRKGRDPMPAWEGILSEEELWNLINYLRFEIGAHHGPGFNPVGSYNRGSRFGYCADQYRTGEDMTDNHRDQAKENLHEDQTHQAMEHEDTQGQSNELADQERHDEHEDE